MKKAFLIIIAISTIGILSSNKEPIENIYNTKIVFQSSFQDGWKDGYKEGWTEIKGKYSTPPYAPYPPYPEAGKDTYKDGYNKGFRKGMDDANR